MPNRILYATARQSKKLAACSAEEERLYWRLMQTVDDFGRYQADPDMVRAAGFPRQLGKVTDADVATWLDGLHRHGLIVLYQVGDDAFLEVTNWRQRTRAQSSTCPAPDGQMTVIRPSSAHGDGDGDGDVERHDQNGYEKGRAPSGAFNAFWVAYPRKVGKPKARAAFTAAVKRVGDVKMIVAGAQRYREDPNRSEEFTAHPTTWLNRDGWEDDPLPRHGDPVPAPEPPTERYRRIIEGQP